MITKFIEATDQVEFNYGKFAVMKFTPEEWNYESQIDKNHSLVRMRGWSEKHLLALDIQTGEGAFFLPGGMASHDLGKHQIWVCPLFEPFLEWLYKQDTTDITKLPASIVLQNDNPSMTGYRRGGIWNALFEKIKHGDQAHQDWLRNAIEDFAAEIKK